MTSEVTRLEIADHLDPLFARGATDREAVLTAVSGARPELAEVLYGLPQQNYSSLRQVWKHLPDVPVGL
ncbi:hypothetical protein DVA86_08915 [Streptomyces armeniacus]|uniref:DUF2795 domain-containing protein n=1 Tax=Streptomyces armeniacus TaxID=83291 RepID=A0A345XM81_9ACTN|nr:hypothetical protein [Streptomyces armeniacus]AXK32747.1 hypothetical protein DVA86_08915 [Streptomyces armeniacus]